MSTHIYGIRHHGPGSARSLRLALEALRPDVLLVEGPPEAEGILSLLTHEAMKPPVAMLLYVPEQPQRAVFYPFALFSPEWQALRYGLERGIPIRFMDLPQSIQLAAAAREAADEPEGPIPLDDNEPAEQAADASTREAAAAPDATEPTTPPSVQDDPIGWLAEAAGYRDRELWWEQQIEQRLEPAGVFEGIMEAMAALRAEADPPREQEAQREAHMRQIIRAAERDGFARIAVVCGAWHAPALTALDDAAGDAALLADLPRIEVRATWIPWTNARLSARSGYGAGITSPGWYGHLWAAPDRLAVRWMTRVAQLLRAEDLDASPASVIEAVRLAEALAAMRELPMPGLAELNEAALAVLCQGEAAPMALIREQLEIGTDMGDVPPETPTVPLQQDVDTARRRLKLTDRDLDLLRARRKLAPSMPLVLDLDLRNETDLGRSRLIHRLRLLSIPWGTPQRGSANQMGTFHEVWQLAWQPEYTVKLIEANVWGNTLEAAGVGFVTHVADEAEALPRLTELLDAVTLAELPRAVEHLLGRIQALAAVSADVRHLMDALPPLARVARYGTVRGRHSERVLPIIDGLFERAVVGLPGACASLDDAAAGRMVESIDHTQAALDLLDRADQRESWHVVLRGLLTRDTVHGLVRGRCCRLLLEKGALDDGELRRLARLALSPVTPAPQAAAWVQGLLHGSGLLLLQQDGLWMALDAWLSELAPDAFVGVLPLLRRAFASFPAPQRRAMGEKLKRLRARDGAGPAAEARDGDVADGIGLNRERADGVLAVLAHVLGVSYDGND